MIRRPEPGALVGGAAIVLLGVLLLLDQLDVLALGFGWLLPALAAAAGIVLVASGLGSRDG